MPGNGKISDTSFCSAVIAKSAEQTAFNHLIKCELSLHINFTTRRGIVVTIVDTYFMQCDTSFYSYFLSFIRGVNLLKFP